MTENHISQKSREKAHIGFTFELFFRSFQTSIKTLLGFHNMRQMYSIIFTLYLPQRLGRALGDSQRKNLFLRFYFFMTPYGIKKSMVNTSYFVLFQLYTLTRSLPKTSSTKRELILIEMRVFRQILQRRYIDPFSILFFPRAVLQFLLRFLFSEMDFSVLAHFHELFVR